MAEEGGGIAVSLIRATRPEVTLDDGHIQNTKRVSLHTRTIAALRSTVTAAFRLPANADLHFHINDGQDLLTLGQQCHVNILKSFGVRVSPHFQETRQRTFCDFANPTTAVEDCRCQQYQKLRDWSSEHMKNHETDKTTILRFQGF